jgi:hypothetical protein
LQAGFSYGRLQPAPPPRELQQVCLQRFLLKHRLQTLVGIIGAVFRQSLHPRSSGPGQCNLFGHLIQESRQSIGLMVLRAAGC